MEQIARTPLNSHSGKFDCGNVVVNPVKYVCFYDYAAQALDDCLHRPGPRPIPGFSGSLLLSPVVPVAGFEC